MCGGLGGGVGAGMGCNARIGFSKRLVFIQFEE